MIKKAVNLIFYLFFSFGCIFSVNAASNSASSANRRTAVRYLQLSKQFASEKLWKEADSNAKMGLAYDDKIADLWYLSAVSQMNLGEKKSQVLPLVVTALTDSEWVDYNRDGARILYADILCSTRLFTQALSTLDSSPFIYSADAEYIRAKAYYCLGDTESIKKARDKIDSARRVYPADSRFAELFYTYEYQLLRKTGSVPQEAQKLADAFALTVPLYKNAGDDLEVYAALFSSAEKIGKNESKKSRMLKAFNSKRKTSPLYAIEALKIGLLTEDDALDYFYKFSDKQISISMLEDFASLLKTDEAKKEFSEYLNAYNGTIFFDTDEDIIPNMKVVYNRGRPQSISYDENQDDENDWRANCDFGVPLNISMSENAVELDYSAWPYVSSATYKMESLHSNLKITLIAETLAWTPFTVVPNLSIKNSLDFDFFVPSVSSGSENSVSGTQLLKSALNYTIPSRERAGAVIQVSLLNGVAQIASYSVGDKIYAMAQFENGIPVSRKLDSDGDGLFETTEFYGYSPDFYGTETEAKFISTSDEMQIMTNLFGSPATGTGFYVKKITVDQNGDTIPDFTEEYLPANLGAKIPGKISSWDLNGDGKWEVQYVKQPSQNDDIVREESKFHYSLVDSAKFSEETNSSIYEDYIITVFSENALPVSVECKNQSDSDAEVKKLAVKKSNQKAHANFYWLGENSAQENPKSLKIIEEKILDEINQIGEQGVSSIVESEKNRYLAVRVEKLIFAMEISDENLPDLVEDKTKKQKKQ